MEFATPGPAPDFSLSAAGSPTIWNQSWRTQFWGKHGVYAEYARLKVLFDLLFCRKMYTASPSQYYWESHRATPNNGSVSRACRLVKICCKFKNKSEDLTRALHRTNMEALYSTMFLGRLFERKRTVSGEKAL